MGKRMDSVLCFIKTGESMRDSGKMIREVAMELKNFPTDAFTKDSLVMESQMGWEVILGQMVNITMDNGSLVFSMDQVCGGDLKEIHISGNGSSVNLMDMACTPGRTEIHIRENFVNA